MIENQIGSVNAYVPKQEIESHNSNLTNLRVHHIEVQIDRIRVLAGRSPTIENLSEYFFLLKSWHSYLNTVISDKTTEDLKNRIQGFDDALKYNVYNKECLDIKKKHPKGYIPEIQRQMLEACEKMADEIRKQYQTLRYYFRTGGARQSRSLSADLQASINRLEKTKKKEVTIEE